MKKKIYIYDGVEVQLTGRTAIKVSDDSQQRERPERRRRPAKSIKLYEIAPTVGPKRWVKMSDLYVVEDDE